ncbi:MAG: hypothetical protein GXZ08_05210 [Tissierellia bacterium]|nr:hypothetical protein [Tissierellia bacterium]
MREANIFANLKSSPRSVWEVITNKEDYSWRSDLEKIEIVDETKFIEYHKSGNKTVFIIVDKIPYEEYRLNIFHDKFTGEWVAKLKEKSDGTTIEIYKKIEMTDKLTELMSYMSINMKMEQKIYIRDLKKKLGEEV